MRRFERSKSDQGFTMIELVVVCVVLLIFTMVVLSTYQYSNAITDKLMAETDGLKVSLRFAQMQAFNDDTAPWGISFSTNTTYRLYANYVDASMTIPVKGQTNDSGDPVTLTCPQNCHQLSGNVQITSTVPIINFDKWGRPLDGSGNLLLQDPRITLSVVPPGTDMHIFGVDQHTGFIYDVP